MGPRTMSAPHMTQKLGSVRAADTCQLYTADISQTQVCALVDAVARGQTRPRLGPRDLGAQRSAFLRVLRRLLVRRIRKQKMMPLRQRLAWFYFGQRCFSSMEMEQVRLKFPA